MYAWNCGKCSLSCKVDTWCQQRGSILLAMLGETVLSPNVYR